MLWRIPRSLTELAFLESLEVIELSQEAEERLEARLQIVKNWWTREENRRWKVCPFDCYRAGAVCDGEYTWRPILTLE
jgi:hypothetical protein